MKVGLPELLWYGNTILEIDLPDDWEVEVCPMRGAGRAPLSLDEMAHGIKNPIGCAGLAELSRGKKSAVIIFDDITRPTRVFEIAPLVIRELISGGIDEEEITFVCALGNHGAHTNHEFRKKLGVELLEKFRVFNHNPYEHCEYVGETTRGTKLMVNREVMRADLKIGIGCVTAHPNVGFSGGGKIILPGVSHYDSSSHNHIEVCAQAPQTTGLGNFDDNVMRFNIEEATRMAGLDFKVDVIVNYRGETTALFAGDPVEMHTEAVRLAKDVYATHPRPRNKALMITNAFTKANEMPIAILSGGLALENFAGTVLVIANAPEGQVTHYLLRSFGREYGGRQYPVGMVPDSLNVILIAPYMDKNFTDWVKNPEAITVKRSWDEALPLLRESFGSGTRVGIIPDATMQYYDS
jgi:nickel-dependent lactate racemase